METKTKLAPDELRHELRQFIGTEHWHRVLPGMVITDGVKFLAEKTGAYWLVDAIWSHLGSVPEDAYIAFARLKVQDHAGVLQLMADIEDDGTALGVFVAQRIAHTDFPLPEIMLYVVRDDVGWILLLPSEY